MTAPEQMRCTSCRGIGWIFLGLDDIANDFIRRMTVRLAPLFSPLFSFHLFFSSGVFITDERRAVDLCALIGP